MYDFVGAPFCLGHVDDFITGKPYKLTLFGEDWVIWKNNQDEIRIIDNICPHAAAPLSAGNYCSQRDTIICPYHRYEFDGDGNWTYFLDPSSPHADKRVYVAEQMNNLDNKHSVLTKQNATRNLPFINLNGFIWTYGYGVEAILPLPKTIMHMFDSGAFQLANVFRFESKAPLIYFLENLVDIDHFLGSHKQTFFADAVELTSCVRHHQQLRYTFFQHKKDLTWLESLRNPMSLLFNSKQLTEVDIAVPSIGCFSSKLGDKREVNVILTWYPKNNGIYSYRAGFYENFQMPWYLKPLRNTITNFRRQAVKEDLQMINSLYHGKYERKIKVQNEQPLYLLRKILQDTYHFEFKNVS